MQILEKHRNFLAFLAPVLLAACGAGHDEPAYDTSFYESDERPDYPELMADYREAFERSALPVALAQAAVAETGPFDSKLAGQPYWPKDLEYPRDKDGEPLRLLAQINFEDVPPVPDFPDTGILQFFIAPGQADNQIWGLEFHSLRTYTKQEWFRLLQQPNYFRVVYHESVTRDKSRLLDEFPRLPKHDFFPVDDEARLRFTSGVSHVSNWDYRFKRFFGEDAWTFFEQYGEDGYRVEDQYWLHVRPDAIAWLNGYATFSQEDPRFAVPDEDWVLLLEIESSFNEGGPEVLWGDVGTGTFFIRPEDLRRRDFSKVAYSWDSS